MADLPGTRDNAVGGRGDDWATRYNRERPRGISLVLSRDDPDAGDVFPTEYVPSHLLVSSLIDQEAALEALRRVAEPFRWTIQPDPDFAPLRVEESKEVRAERSQRLGLNLQGPLGLDRYLIVPAPSSVAAAVLACCSPHWLSAKR